MPKTSKDRAEELMDIIPVQYIKICKELNKERTEKEREKGIYPSDQMIFKIIGAKLNMTHFPIRNYVEQISDISNNEKWQGYLRRFQELNNKEPSECTVA